MLKSRNYSITQKSSVQTYSENKDYEKFIACVDMIDTMEQKIVELMIENI